MANIQTNRWQISRRRMLRGMGATMALPLLEAMVPMLRAAPGQPGALPARLACIYFPNGVRADRWTPDGEGARFKLSPILSPLEAHREDILVLTNLCNKATFTGDGHYVKTGGWLTGTTITKTTGSEISANGVSMDQMAAATIGRETKLPSLELGTEPVAQGVDKNVNYTRLYASHIAWKTPTVPLPCEINPRVAFDRLFRGGSRAGRQDAAERKSILDVVKDDADRLRADLGTADRRKVEEYLESVREVERRIENEARLIGAGENLAPEAMEQLKILDQRISRAMGKGSREEELGSAPRFDFTEHVQIMMDIMVLAFWSDSTRVSTFMFGNDVSGRSFSFLDGVSGGHHEISHHQNNQKQLDQYERINRWHVEQFAYLLERMKGIKEGDGTLLDHSALLFGSSIRDGNGHDPKNLPLVLAGRANGEFKTGRHIVCDPETPMCNLSESLLKSVGAPVRQIGDSTGPLRNLG